MTTAMLIGDAETALLGQGFECLSTKENFSDAFF